MDTMISASEVIEVATSELNNGINVRTNVSIAGLESIKEVGIKNPLLVYDRDGYLFVLEGHRRLAAAIAYELPTVPCVLRPAPESDMDEMLDQLIINSTQQPLSFMDKARKYAEIKAGGLSQVEIARRMGVSEPEVSLAIKATSAHPKLQEALDAGRIAPSAIEPLLPLPVELQGELAEAAIREKTVRKINALVAMKKNELGLGRGSKPVQKVELSDDIDPMELVAIDSLEEALHALQAAVDNPVQNAELKEQARTTVRQLMATARRLHDALSE